MTQSDRASALQSKKAYEKPVLRSISLAVDQVLGNTCKGQFNNPTLNLNGEPDGCFTKLCMFQLGS